MSRLAVRILEADRAGRLIVLAVEPKAVSVRDAARLVDLSESKVRRLINAGRFPAVEVDGRTIVPVAAIDAWLAQHVGEGAA